MQKNYDALIIGSGPGGEGTAMQLAKGGWRVAVIEAKDIGGNCTHRGTIPSKALRHVVGRLTEYNNNPIFQNHQPNGISYKDAVQTASKVISRQTQLRSGFYTRNNIDLYHGFATFMDANTLQVTQANQDKPTILTGKRIVIATGSRPYRPEDIDFNHPNIFDADTILNMSDTPRCITIYGAGVIGCEYASIFRGLGCKVNLINTRSQLLEFLDDEIVDALTYHLRDQGIVVRHDEEMASVETQPGGQITLHTKSGKAIHSDTFLFANGRSGNTQDMGLKNIGVKTNHRGQIEINNMFTSSVESILGVGDVIGPPALASAAYDQGRFVAEYLLEQAPDRNRLDNIPTGIYTLPEISSLGPTESELTKAAIPYEVGRAMFKDLARAQIMDVRVGMLKILFCPDTLKVLGIHCFGSQASEIIHIGQAIMQQTGDANSLNYFIQTTFNYPTMAEAYRVAALNGKNRIQSCSS